MISKHGFALDQHIAEDLQTNSTTPVSFTNDIVLSDTGGFVDLIVEAAEAISLSSVKVTITLGDGSAFNFPTTVINDAAHSKATFAKGDLMAVINIPTILKPDLRTIKGTIVASDTLKKKVNIYTVVK